MQTAETTRSGQSASGASGSADTQGLKADADRLTNTAKDRASDMAEAGKDKATGAARSASDALEKAASHLEGDDGAPGWLASAFRETAKGIDRLAGKVEGRSPEQISREASRMAREHPGAFLAASAAAGFAAARFLRAGADYQQHHKAGGTSGMNRSGSTGNGRFADETRAAQQRYGAGASGSTTYAGGMSQ